MHRTFPLHRRLPLHTDFMHECCCCHSVRALLRVHTHCAGWLALTKGLFRKGYSVTVAFQHLQKGLQEGWNPDASLFEYVIQAFCVADNMEQAQRVLASMPDLGCPPRTVHINLLVELVARLEGAYSPALARPKSVDLALKNIRSCHRCGRFVDVTLASIDLARSRCGYCLTFGSGCRARCSSGIHRARIR
jgi:hypothetical protein